jgi:hypothetical protein
MSIVVTDTGTGGTSKLYSVEVIRDEEDTSLVALSVSTGDLGPEFDKDTFDYSVNNVGPSFTKITISATKSDPNAVMDIGSVTIPAGSASGRAEVTLGGTGSATEVPIVVTAKGGGSKRTYKVSINRGPSDNAFLGSLSISSAKLDFKPKNTVYSVSVASGVNKVTVTAKPQDPTANIAFLLNGSATDPKSITLPSPGAPPAKVTIRVTAQKGNSRDYEINVKRAALNGNNDLSSLSVTPGSLKFDADQTSYTVRVGSSIEKVTVKAEPQVSTTSIAIEANGIPINAQPITLLGPGLTTFIKIRATAQNNQFQDYVINVDRDALGGNNNLSALSVTAGGKAQPLDVKADPPNYTVDVASTVGTVDISATKDDPTAEMSGDVTAGAGQKVGKNTITLDGPGTKNVVLITVTAPNGRSKLYRITVNQAALGSNNKLSALKVTAGTAEQSFSPPFDSNTVTVASEVTEVVVRATDANATMAIGGDTVGAGTTSGQATFQLNGAGGEPTTISFTVTAQNGVDLKTYTISVIRPAASTKPPKPTVAPDLIEADDSCPLNNVVGGDPTQCLSGTSRADNITNVPQPRFRVAPLASGETPILYVDGDQVKVGFDQGTDTLTPTSPMKDGKDRKVTSTVKNAAGVESLPSDPLLVTIDTKAPGN